MKKPSILLCLIIGFSTIMIFYIKSIYGNELVLNKEHSDSNSMDPYQGQCPDEIVSFMQQYKPIGELLNKPNSFDSITLTCVSEKRSGDIYFLWGYLPSSYAPKPTAEWDWIKKTDNSYLKLDEKDGNWYNASYNFTDQKDAFNSHLYTYHLTFIKMKDVTCSDIKSEIDKSSTKLSAKQSTYVAQTSTNSTWIIYIDKNEHICGNPDANLAIY